LGSRTGQMVPFFCRLHRGDIAGQKQMKVAIAGWIVASWLTHIVYALKIELHSLLIAGAVFWPIAWIHGTGVWIGAW